MPGAGNANRRSASSMSSVCPGGWPKIRIRVTTVTLRATLPHQPSYQAAGGSGMAEGVGPTRLSRLVVAAVAAVPAVLGQVAGRRVALEVGACGGAAGTG